MCSALNVLPWNGDADGWKSLVLTTLGTTLNVPVIPNARMLEAKSSETGQMTDAAWPVARMAQRLHDGTEFLCSAW